MDEAAQGSSLGFGKDTLRKAGAVVNKSERKTLLPRIDLSRLGRQDKSVRQTMLCGVSHRAAFLFSVFWKREFGGVPPAVHESAPKNAAHCNGLCSALQCPMERAAMPDAPHCVIWDKRMREKGGIPHKLKDGPPDKAVNCGHRNKGQATGRDGGATDETVKCGHRNEGQALEAG